MKSVLISIRPKWCEKIASGDKTIDVRKTRPKLEPPFRCYIYCTLPSKAHRVICGIFILDDDELYRHPQDGIKYGSNIEMMLRDDCTESNFLNGKIIGEFTCDRIDKIIPSDEPYGIYDISDDYVRQTCLENGALWDYGHGTSLYGWHISDLKIYDKPRELREFQKSNRDCFYADLGLAKRDCPDCKNSGCFLERPPQSWCYVEAMKE